MTAKKKGTSNGVVDLSGWSLEQFGQAADMAIAEAAARREREAMEAEKDAHETAARQAADAAAWAAIYAELDDGPPPNYRAALAAANGKAEALEAAS